MSDKLPNLRLKAWINLMKKFNIIPGQKELAKYVLTEKHTPMKQEYLSLVLNGRKSLTDHVLDQILENFNFLEREFIRDGEGSMIEADKLFRWIIEKEEITQSALSELLDIPASTMNKLRNHHVDGEWDPIFSYLNHKTDYKIVFDKLVSASSTIGTSKVFKAKNEQTERFLAVIDKLKTISLVNGDKDFADQIGLSANMIYNMRANSVQQGVTLNILAKTIRMFQRVSANYVLNGEGDMFMNEGSAYGIMADIRADQLRMSDQVKSLSANCNIMLQQLRLLVDQ